MAPVGDADDQPSERLPDGNDPNTVTIRVVWLPSQSEKEEEKPKNKDVWERLQVLSAFVMPLVLVGIAYFATGKAETYINETKLQITSAKEMMPALKTLLDARTDSEASSAAMVMASFGAQAILPLWSVLLNSEPIRGKAAQNGLLLLASFQRDTVCDRAKEFFSEHPQWYTFDIHQRVVELLSEAKCRKSLDALLKYQEKITRIAESSVPNAAKEAADTFAKSEELGRDNIKSLKKSVDKGVQVLGK